MIRLAIVATALSVAVMIVSIAVVTGFRYAVTEKLFSFMGHVHVVRFDETKSSALNYSEPVFYSQGLADSIRKIPHVTDVYPFVEKPVLVQANGNMEVLGLKGVNRDYHFMEGITTTGKWIDYSDTAYSRQIMLSKTTANLLNINAGDSVLLDFYENSELRIRKVRVCGIYHSGMEESGSSSG